MNLAEEMMQTIAEDGLPDVGFEVTHSHAALVVTGPRNELLHPDGVAYGVCSESIRENETVENLKRLMEAGTEMSIPLFGLLWSIFSFVVHC